MPPQREPPQQSPPALIQRDEAQLLPAPQPPPVALEQQPERGAVGDHGVPEVEQQRPRGVIDDRMQPPTQVGHAVHVDPAAVSVIRYPVGRPMVLGMNGSGTDLAGLVPAEATETTDTSDANDGGETNVARDTGDEGVVGGGAGRAG